MSIMGGLFSGASGLSAYGHAMSVIGNNLANSNTIGFKGSRVTFEDALSETIGTTAQGANQIGNGVDVAAVSPDLAQGSFEPTSNATDLAVDGRGYFMVQDVSQSGERETFFTRAGDFRISNEDQLVTSQGYVLQGLRLDLSSNPSGSITNIDFAQFQTAPSETSSLVNLAVSLDASVDTLPSTGYDPTNGDTYNFSTSIRIYDSVGEGHNVEIQFIKTGSNTWEWHPVVASRELTSTQRDSNARTLTAVDDPDGDGIRTNVQSPASEGYTHGTLVFSASGSLLQEGSVPVTFNWENGSAPQEVLFNFGSALNTDGDSTNDFSSYNTDLTSANFLHYTQSSAVEDNGNTGTDGSVQYASGFSTINVDQNGFPAGFLSSLSIDESGKMFGSYSNGRVRPLYQVVLASFDNEMALDRVGSNLYRETSISGQPFVGQPNSGRIGAIFSHGLEQSNVDMGDEFVKMIFIQRGFQANSRIISVTDDMLDELLSLKR